VQDQGRPSARTTGRKDHPDGGASAHGGETRASSVRSEEQKGKGWVFPSQANACACAGARARGCALKSMRAHTDIENAVAVRTAVATRLSGKQIWETKKRDGVGVARAAGTATTPARGASQPGLKAGITQRKCGGVLDTTFLPLARWSGFTEGRSELLSPEWPRAEAQALVKGCGAGSATREESAARGRGSKGAGASRFTAPQRPRVPRAASGSSQRHWRTCGWPPSLPTSSPPPFFFTSGERVAWTGEDSPKVARVGIIWGLLPWPLIGEVRRVARGRRKCSGGPRGASRRRPCAAQPCFGVGISKRGKEGR
jgi:hypothetical protein